MLFEQMKINCKRKGRGPTTLLLHLIVLCLANLVILPANATLGCFVCMSVNGSNPSCEDTFNSTILASAQVSVELYQQPCWAFRKNRAGLFPADHCIKVSGHRYGNPNHTLLVRTCALDSGSLTADTEIVRVSHCGHFKYEGHHYRGCVQSCDTDGCNSSPRSAYGFAVWWIVSIATLLLMDRRTKYLPS